MRAPAERCNARLGPKFHNDGRRRIRIYRIVTLCPQAALTSQMIRELFARQNVNRLDFSMTRNQLLRCCDREPCLFAGLPA